MLHAHGRYISSVRDHSCGRGRANRRWVKKVLDLWRGGKNSLRPLNALLEYVGITRSIKRLWRRLWKSIFSRKEICACDILMPFIQYHLQDIFKYSKGAKVFYEVLNRNVVWNRKNTNRNVLGPLGGIVKKVLLGPKYIARPARPPIACTFRRITIKKMKISPLRRGLGRSEKVLVPSQSFKELKLDQKTKPISQGAKVPVGHFRWMSQRPFYKVKLHRRRSEGFVSSSPHPTGLATGVNIDLCLYIFMNMLIQCLEGHNNE